MRVAGAFTVELLLRAAGRNGVQRAPDASSGRAISEDAVLRRAEDDGGSPTDGLRSQREAGASSVGIDGSGDDLSEETASAVGAWSSGLPVFTQRGDCGWGDQVWSTDITYIPLERGFLYLVLILDWHSRFVLSWRLSNTLDEAFCVASLQEALSRGKPEIFNSDQGSQFTSEAFTGCLKNAGVRISMDGRGRAFDNIFVERFWRSLKYEEVYLHAYRDGRETREGIGRYIGFYCFERPHQALENRTPHEVYSAAR